MSSPSLTRKILATSLVVVLAAGAVPVASGIHDLSLLGVGSFLLGADGGLNGLNLVGTLDARSGTLHDVGLRTASDATTPLFSAVSVADFAPRGAPQAIGDAAVRLAGAGAVIHAADTVAAPLSVHALDASTVTYRLAPGVSAVPASVPGVYALQDAQGVVLAHVAHVPAAGSAGGLSADAADTLTARLGRADSTVVRGVPAHAAALPGFHDAVLALASTGLLAHETVADFRGSLDAVHIDYAAGAAATRLTSLHAIESRLPANPGAAASRVLLYDLDYEVLAAQAADEAAVYVDGALAPRAPSVAAFAADAAAGRISSFAAVADGRSMVLASVPASGHHLATVANVAAFAGNPPALAAAALAHAAPLPTGHLALAGPLVGAASGAAATGQAVLLGRHVSAAAVHDHGRFALRHVTDLSSRTLVFDSVSSAAAAPGVDFVHHAADEARFHADAVQFVLHDAPAGASNLAVVHDAPAANPAAVLFAVSHGVTPTLQSAQVARLDGPAGYVGWLVVAAGADPTSWARLAPAAGASSLMAELGPGARALFVSAPAAAAAPDALASSLATRGLGATAAFGLAGQDVVSSVSHHLGADAARLIVRNADIGAVDLAYRATSDAPGASRFVALLDGVVPAQRAHDVRVFIDGGEALRLPSVSAVAAAVRPAYVVVPHADATLVFVNAASQARAPAGAHVSIVSDLVSAAHAHAGDDLFGAFEVLEGGAAVGRYVQARADGAGGVLHDYAVTAARGTTVVFDAIHIGGGGFATPGASGTHRLTFAADDAVVTLTDQTTAVLSVAAESARSVTFVPAAGVEVDRLSPHLVTLSGPNGLVGALMLADVSGASGGAGELVLKLPPDADAATFVRGVDPINVQAVMASGDQVLFRSFAGLEAELGDAERRALADAIASGNVGGQVIVQRAGAASGLVHGVAPAAALDATTSFQSSLDIVTAATAERVTVTLSSALERGRTVLLSVDGGTVPGLAKGAAEILFDGAPMVRASSYADVLDPMDDGGIAEYWILTSTTSGASQVLVSVPSFSVHTVTLQEVDDQESDLFLWVSLGLGLVVVAQGVLLVRMRRRQY